MKKLTIIYGGSVGLYQGYFRVFNEIEKSLGCIIKRVSYFKFITKINNTKVEFLFSDMPTKGKNYYLNKKYLATRWKELIPPPADEVATRIKNTDAVLFLGLCGGFHGKKGDIHTPEEFNELLFKKTRISHKKDFKINPKTKIKLQNFLLSKIKAKKSRVVTSNMALTPDNAVNKDEEIIIKLAQILRDHTEVVEMETYPIVKILGHKFPLGIMLMTSDLVHVKKHMMRHGKFTPHKNIFNKNCIRAIKIALEI
ncbi:MAG: hypothetical protein AABW50_04330 [Nanoarchaeota archaeon]